MYQNSEESEVVQHDKIYLLCDFSDDPWNSVVVIALLMPFFPNLSTLTFNISKE